VIERVVFHIRCDGCPAAFVRVSADDAHIARAGARAAGWSTINDIDRCPTCTRKLPGFRDES